MQMNEKIIIKMEPHDVQISNGVIMPSVENDDIIMIGRRNLDILCSFCSASTCRILSKKTNKKYSQPYCDDSIRYMIYDEGGNAQKGKTTGLVFGQFRRAKGYLMLSAKSSLPFDTIFGMMKKAIHQLELLIDISWGEEDFVEFLKSFATQMSSFDICDTDDAIKKMLHSTGIKQYEEKYNITFDIHPIDPAIGRLMEDFEMTQEEFEEMAEEEKSGSLYDIDKESIPDFVVDDIEEVKKASEMRLRESRRKEQNLSIAAQLFFAGTHAVTCRDAKDFCRIKELAYKTKLGNLEDINDMAWKYFKYIYVDGNRRIKATNRFEKTGCEQMVNIAKL